jgi:hypothetical protein
MVLMVHHHNIYAKIDVLQDFKTFKKILNTSTNITFVKWFKVLYNEFM